MKKFLIGLGIVALLFLGGGGIYLYQKYMIVHTTEVSPEMKILWGGMKSGNSVILKSKDGSMALVVDTKMDNEADDLRKLVNAGEIIVVNTHAHWDHTVGNALYKNAKIISGAYTREQWKDAARSGKYPDISLKPGEEKVITVGDEKVFIKNMGQAHSWDDTIVYFEKSKVLATGDLIFDGVHPAMIAASGCNSDKWIAALDTLIKDYDVKILVPGHGRVVDKTALGTMKDYFISMKDAAANPQKRDEVKKKYRDYFSIPSISGFDMNLKVIKDEMKPKQ